MGAFITCIIFIPCLLAWQMVDARGDDHIKENALQHCQTKGVQIYKADEGLWCCNCPPGYYKSSDCRLGLPTTTTCNRCPFKQGDPSQQTYMDTENNATQCIPVKMPKDCKKFMNTEYIFGSTISDASCQCRNGFFAEYGAIEFGCHEHGKCAPGFHPHKLGTKSKNTMCVECPAGMYSDVHSATAACMPHTVCSKNETELRKGNGTDDTVCVSQEPEAHGNFSDVTEPNLSTSPPGSIEVTGTHGTDRPTDQSIIGVRVGLGIFIIILIAALCFKCLKKKITQQVDLPPPEGKDALIGDWKESSVTYDSRADEDGSDQRLLQPDSTDKPLQHQSLQIVNETKKTENAQTEKEDLQTHSEDANVEDANAPGKCEIRGRDSNCHHRDRESNGFEEKFRKFFQEEDLKDASNKGIRNCCMEKAMEDDAIGKLMIETLQNYNIIETRKYVRTFLNEVKVNDDEHDAHHQAGETRTKWINSIKARHSRQLTPRFIYEKQLTVDEIKDNMSTVFFKQLRRCKGCEKQ